jgi:hypothetical protein
MTSKISQHEAIHKKALERAKTFRRAEADLLDVLQELDTAKTFLHYRCTSLHDYCVRYLKLSDDVTACFIRVARKSKEVPELKEAIRNDEITVSKAKRIASVMTKDNSNHWLELARTLPKHQLEKEVAKIAPQTATPEKTKYVSADRIYVSLGVSEDCMKGFKRVQDLLSQRTRKSATLEKALRELVDFYLQRNDPLEKAKRNFKVEGKAQNSNNLPGPGPGQNDTTSTRKRSRKPLLAQTKHQINLRDRMEHTDLH